MSEAINFSCLMPVDLSKSEIDHWLTFYDRPSIGCELSYNHVFVADDAGNLLEEGEVGEICIRGYNVMLGYKNSDNQSVFKHGFLNTGDLGFFKTSEKSGRRFFFISGRRKDVIKRGASTISLVEIDDFLQSLLNSRSDAIAVSFENENLGEELAVVVRADVDSEVILSMIRENLFRLPSSIRPRLMILSHENLRTSSGKPQRWKFASLFEEYSKSLLKEKEILILT